MCRKFGLYVLTLLAISYSSFAAWVGPEAVVSGGWGGEPNQFAIEENDSETIFPLVTDVSSEGRMVISDEYNGRMKVYSENGSLLWSVVPPVSNPIGWATKPVFVIQNLMVPLDRNYFYSNSGELIDQVESPDRMDFWGEVDGRLYISESEPAIRWLTYSPTGSLLNTYTEKPLELGRIEDKIFFYQGKKMHRVVISFPERKWYTPDEVGPCGEYDYQLDNSGNLYCVGQQAVLRYSACGKVVSQLTLPDPQWEVVASFPDNPGIDDVSRLVEEYAGLVLGDDGSVYSSRATQANYSVVKWTWQTSPDDPVGGPDAPIDLSAVAGSDGTTLNWTYSLQDPGCVTNYEIARSTTAGGPYTKLAEVPATGKTSAPYTYADNTAESGMTYYYAVRAISTIANSPYSNEVSAQGQ